MKTKKYLDNIHRTGVLHRTGVPVGKRCHAGERTQKFPEHIWREFTSSLQQEDLLFYPNCQALQEKLAQRHGVSVDEVMITAGADGALKCIIDTFTDVGSTILVPEYHFPMYDVYAAQNGANVCKLLYMGLILTPTPEIPEESIQDLRLVVTAHPNSPVGDSPDERFYRHIEDFNVPIVVDSVYEAFSDNKLDVKDKLTKNYIFVYSFSKEWGGPGARIGYAIASKNILAKMSKMKQMTGISGVGLKFADWALKNEHFRDDYVQRCVEFRKEIAEIHHHNIGGNWVHLPNFYAKFLDEAGITYKANCKLPGVRDELLRVTVSQELYNVFKEVVTNAISIED